MQEYKGPIPTKEQIKYHEEEISCFLHFGMNTFTNKEWGDGSETIEDFKLKDFDYDSYVSFIKNIGFKRLIFTAKHHDGFCMFDSKYTDFKITNTNYKKDFLLELSKSCTKYDIDMGIYLSPWDIHEKSYGTGEKYNEYYMNQIVEIASNPKYGNNGKFVEWWFDSAKDTRFKEQIYDFEKWKKTVKKYNPNILLFGLGSEGEIHWIGNEKGYAPEENAPRIIKNGFETIDYNNEFRSNIGHQKDYVRSVPEADTTTTNGWFSHNNEIVKSKDELFNIYLKSVGRGAVLLLNIATDKNGNINEKVKENVIYLKNKIKEDFSTNLVKYFEITTIQDNENILKYEIKNNHKIKVKYLVIKEDISMGSRFQRGYIIIDGERINLPSIGYKRIINFEKYGYKCIESISIFLEGNCKLYIKPLEIY